MNIGNICNPFAVWSVCPELPFQQVLILMNLLTKVYPLPPPADLCQQTIFLHYSKYSFRISFDISISQPFPNPSVTICLICLALTLFYLFCQLSVMLRLALSLHKVVVTAAGYSEEPAHNRYRILAPVTINYRIFYLWPHILSMDCRKSRISLFSIRSRSSSFWVSSLGGNPSLRGRPLALGTIPCFSISLRRLCRVIQSLICFLVNPSSSAISCRVIPVLRIDIICVSIILICVYFLLDITLPPDVIILHQGAFCLLSVFTGSVQ